MADEFYRDGLRFECQPNCGSCCSQKGDVYVHRDDVRRLATFLRLPIRQLRRRFLRRIENRIALADNEHGACVFLDQNMRCTVYEARPDQCRTYPFWPAVLSSRLAWDWEALKCPGIGRGPIIPASEIRRLMDLSGE